MNFIIREMNPEEYVLLSDFLYEAIFQRDENNLLPRDIINDPALSLYVDGFGGAHDYCLVAEIENRVVGAVWVRIINGFGHISDDIPEFAISLHKPFRGNGIGTELMKKMLQLLKSKGYQKASLAVQKDNYAFKMYQNMGFMIVDENDEEYIMVCDL